MWRHSLVVGTLKTATSSRRGIENLNYLWESRLKAREILKILRLIFNEISMEVFRKSLIENNNSLLRHNACKHDRFYQPLDVIKKQKKITSSVGASPLPLPWMTSLLAIVIERKAEKHVTQFNCLLCDKKFFW